MRQTPVFIVGLWRSGTSLLQTLLNQHSDVQLMHEGELLGLQPLFGRSGPKDDWFERWEFWNGSPTRHGIHAPPRAPLHGTVEAIYRNYAGTHGASVWGEKSPGYSEQLVELWREWPDARFIVLWRNVFDIARSVAFAGRKSQYFGRRGMFTRTIGMYERLRASELEIRAKGANVHAVQYEDLVTDPAGVLSGICAFLEVEFEPKMATLEGADRSSLPEGDHNAGVKSDAVRKSKRTESLEQRDLDKLERYVARWKQVYGPDWPKHPASVSAAPCSDAEHLADTLLYAALRGRERLAVYGYCHAPPPLLRAWRAYRQRSFDQKRTRPNA